MERTGKAWDFSSYLVKKFLKDEKRMRKEWERMGKKRVRNWMGRKWNLMGENGKGNGGYVNLPFLRKMKIFGFAYDNKCNEAISHILSRAKSRIHPPKRKSGKT